jgi:hypothetical protein
MQDQQVLATVSQGIDKIFLSRPAGCNGNGKLLYNIYSASILI